MLLAFLGWSENSTTHGFFSANLCLTENSINRWHDGDGDGYLFTQGESLPQLDVPYGKYVGHPRGSRDRRKPALHLWTWLEILPEDKKKEGKDWQVWSFETNGSNWILLFWRVVVFKMIYLHYFIHRWLHRIIFCWSQVRNAFIGFCSAAVSDTCAVAQWIAGQLASWRRRHQTRWWGETPTSNEGCLRTDPCPQTKMRRWTIVASELVCLFFF